jgi:hypothetical protein
VFIIRVKAIKQLELDDRLVGNWVHVLPPTSAIKFIHLDICFD